jgi:hypothetical protein
MNNNNNMQRQELINHYNFRREKYQNKYYDRFYNLNYFKQRNDIYQNKYMMNKNYNYSIRGNLSINNIKNSYLNSELNQKQGNDSNISSLKKEKNIYKKINILKRNHRRKASIDTIVSTSSFISSSSYKKEEFKNEEEVEEEKDGQINDFSSNSFDDNKDLKKNADNKINDKNGIYKGNSAFENTEILRVNVKISKDKNAIFRIKRFDDVFETIKLFCEINSIDEKLIKPLIIKSLCTLNIIYQIMNCKLDNEDINLMKRIQKEKI